MGGTNILKSYSYSPNWHGGMQVLFSMPARRNRPAQHVRLLKITSCTIEFLSIKIFSGCFLLECRSSCRYLLLSPWPLLTGSCKVPTCWLFWHSASCLLCEHEFWVAIKAPKSKRPCPLVMATHQDNYKQLMTPRWNSCYNPLKSYLFLNQLNSWQWLKIRTFKIKQEN